ncbi:hypothetical protein GCWU000342_00500 [Shuttleworthella satelles DSM 14600]|uniref:Uncharacterized protein n=2 Tax=Shuttleworthella TaxID=177971 RepID=C4G950_9FIRM|nr:hypothetical protein GCWU000342_00500 [Shuttleworthia satelles DSM 14600]
MASAEREYWFGEAFQGQGIMPEAVKEMLRHRSPDEEGRLAGDVKIILRV